jgi:peptidoglycan/xylan/chitin deacetylase (PgdA/CDA1 family)
MYETSWHFRVALISIACFVLAACETKSGDWPNGANAAVALTYDDAMDSQLDNAVPALSEYGFKGTFYISLRHNNFEARKEEWAKVAKLGHELGNHTMVHPCQGSKPDRDWVSPDRDLDNYTLEKFVDELEAANEILDAIDGGAKRTFAYPCGDTDVGGVSYIDELRPLFLGARSVVRDTPYDPYFVASFAVDNTPANEMIAYIDELIDTGSVGTITFHGIGADHLAVTTEDHAKLLAYLETRNADIWVAPLRDIQQYKK